MRDYINDIDIAEWYLSSLNSLLKEKLKILNLNLWTDLGNLFLEIINTFHKVHNINENYNFKEIRRRANAILVAANSLKISILNWKPNKSRRYV